MTDKPYLNVPLYHLSSPYAPPPLEETAPAEELRPQPSAPSVEPFGMLDVDEPPERYGVDEATVLARDPFTLFAHWEIIDESLAAARERLGSQGILVLRLDATAGPIIDYPLPLALGRGYLPAPFPGAWLVPVLGLRDDNGGFAPIASAPPLRVPWSHPEEEQVEWVEVTPTRTRGAQRERPDIVRRGVTVAGGDDKLAEDHGLWPNPPQRRAAAPTSEDVPTSPTRGGR